MLLYKHALLLYKIYNNETFTMCWIEMNFQQNFNARLKKFIVHTVFNYKVGKNLPINRLVILNNTIELKLQNLTWDTFKVHCKDFYWKALAEGLGASVGLLTQSGTMIT